MNTNSTNIENTNEELVERLETLIQGNDIASEIASEALEYHDPEAFFEDLRQHGCVSGMIGSLIYYTDTHKFFEKHYDEIQILKEEWEEEIGEPLKIT